MAIQIEHLQEIEAIPLKPCSADKGKREEDLTEALLEISEKVLEDDQKAIEWYIKTGWEEAVRGWGPVSGTACLYPQRKPKKPKPGLSSDCMMCLDLKFLPDSKEQTLETTQTTPEGKSMSKPPLAANITPPVDKELNPGCTDQSFSNGKVSNTQTNDGPVSPAETSFRDQSLHRERTLSQLPGGVIPLCTNCYNSTKESRTLHSPALLPPLKGSAGAGHTDQLTRRRAFLTQQLEKPPARPSLDNTESKPDRSLLKAVNDLPQESLSYISSFISGLPSGNAERFQLLAHKSNSANAVKQSGSPGAVGFLHTRAMQNKRNVQQEIRALNVAKTRRPKSHTAPLLTNTMLPSLTVRRVEIPERIRLY